MAGKDGSRDTYTSRALDIAEIKTLMLVKEIDPKVLQRLLDKKDVEKLEDLDELTIRNFLQYLWSLRLRFPIPSAVATRSAVAFFPHDSPAW